MAGLEVEDLRPVAPPFHGVVVGRGARGRAASRTPTGCASAQVDVGAAEPLQIVCGAPNVRAGMKAPCALVGAELPPAEDGATRAVPRSSVGKMRGVESHGMLCSARELKLSDDHGGLLALADDAPVGADLRERSSSTTRCSRSSSRPTSAMRLSVYGIAREVAALTGAPLKTPAFAAGAGRRIDDDAAGDASRRADLCGRFSGPHHPRRRHARRRRRRWMVDRLARCGQRTVSPLVDISNYVMFEFGRPSHIFDLDKIDGGLVVRWGRPGETLKLLNGSTVELDATVGVIADDAAASSRSPASWAATRPRCPTRTRNVYVEAAFWWPEAVAGRSRRYQLLDRRRPPLRARRRPGDDGRAHRAHHAADHRHLRRRDTRCGPIDDQVVALPERDAGDAARRARRQGDRHAGHAGRVRDASCARLGLPSTGAPGRARRSTPPSWRFDLTIEEDLIEEVIRVDRLRHAAAPRRRARTLTAQVPQRDRGAAPHALRHALAASTTRRRSTSASSTSAGSATSPATPTRSACSTRSPRRCR